MSIGFTNADHGAISVQGNVALGGTLDVSASGSVPAGSYTILSTSGGGVISGTFDTENIPGEFSIQYTAS